MVLLLFFFAPALASPLPRSEPLVLEEEFGLRQNDTSDRLFVPDTTGDGHMSSQTLSIKHVFANVRKPGDIKKKVNWPSEFDGPIRVHVGFYVESVGNLQAVNMAFDTDIYFHMSWNDYRLRHDEGIKILNSDAELKGMWLPDLYFANAKTAKFQDVIIPNRVVYVYSDGTVSYSARIVLDLACNLKLSKYPLDKQCCKFRILSYAHTVEEMQVKWLSSDPLSMNPDIAVPEYTVKKFLPDYCDGSYAYAITEEKKRLASLIEIISWVGFFIDPNAVPARVSLSFTTLLTISTMGTGLKHGLPAVSYAKAIDIWFGACMIFVFGALVEFTIVNGYMRESKKLETLAGFDTALLASNSVRLLSPNGSARGKPAMSDSIFLHEAKQVSVKALRVDKYSRVLFPLAFIFWNITYWVIYTEA